MVNDQKAISKCNIKPDKKKEIKHKQFCTRLKPSYSAINNIIYKIYCVIIHNIIITTIIEYPILHCTLSWFLQKK